MATEMNANQLFAQLVQRFRSYSDASVLWILLKEHADVREISVTPSDLSTIELCNSLPRTTIQRTIQRLQELGFISVRSQKNTRTLITVHREVVLDFLRAPLPERLPAVSRKSFPFLNAWNEDIAEQAAQVAIEKASANEGGKSGGIPTAG